MHCTHLQKAERKLSLYNIYKHLKFTILVSTLTLNANKYFIIQNVPLSYIYFHVYI